MTTTDDAMIGATGTTDVMIHAIGTTARRRRNIKKKTNAAF
jgi:hypothetical protein